MLLKVRPKLCEYAREPRGGKKLHLRGSFPKNRSTCLENTLCMLLLFALREGVECEVVSELLVILFY